MSAENSAAEIETWRKLVKDSVSRLPAAFSELLPALTSMNHAFRQEMAEALAAPLNSYIRAQAQYSYAEKQQLASWINHELREFGLAIRCPQTNSPAILVADYRNDPERDSRFRLESHASDGRKVRSSTGQTVPHLTLMDDHPPQQQRNLTHAQRLRRHRAGGDERSP